MELPIASCVVLLFAAGLARGEDCNENDAEDAVDISGGASADCNRNGIPDDCELGPGLPFGYATAESIADVSAKEIHLLDIEGDGNLEIAAGGLGGIDIIESDGGLLRRVQHFDPPEGLSYAGEPSLTDADLDLDGDLDLVASIANYPPAGALFVLRNQGDGTFDELAFLHAAENPRFVVASELDGDGTPDLLTNKSREGFILVSGASGEAVSLLVPNLLTLGSAATGDLDGDGDNDIAFGDVYQGVFAMENLGSTSFGEPSNLVAEDVESVQLLDVDSDGDLDLASETGFFVNDGTGSFTETLAFPTPGRLADVDGDGDLDLFRTHWRDYDDREGFSGISIRVNAGGNAFGPAVAFPTWGLRTPSGVAFLDVNGDGRPDLVMGTASPDGETALASFLNDGLPYSQGDADRNGVIDVCEVFQRGDANGNGVIDISDPAFLLNYIFLGGSKVPCLEAADGNNDGQADISDAVFILSYHFLGGRAPPPPGPECGKDPEGGDLGCTSYTGCGDFDLGS